MHGFCYLLEFKNILFFNLILGVVDNLTKNLCFFVDNLTIFRATVKNTKNHFACH